MGRFTLDSEEYSWKCAYEMVLVERIQGKPKTEGGLFVPTEDMPKLHLCRGKCRFVWDLGIGIGFGSLCVCLCVIVMSVCLGLFLIRGG